MTTSDFVVNMRMICSIVTTVSIVGACVSYVSEYFDGRQLLLLNNQEVGGELRNVIILGGFTPVKRSNLYAGRHAVLSQVTDQILALWYS